MASAPAPIARRTLRGGGLRTGPDRAIARSTGTSAPRSTAAATMHTATTTATWWPWETACALVGVFVASAVASHAERIATAVVGTAASSAVGSVCRRVSRQYPTRPIAATPSEPRENVSSSVAPTAGSRAAAPTRTAQCSSGSAVRWKPRIRAIAATIPSAFQ